MKRPKALDYATAGAFLYLVYELVRPRASTAQIVAAQMSSFAMVTQAMVEVKKRDEQVVTTVKAMPKDTRAALEGFLHASDRMWLEAMMMGVDE